MLVDTAKDVNENKERWLRALEDVHSILCALVTLFATQTQDLLSPTMLDTVGRLARVLQKIQSCVRSQQELGILRRFFKQTEILEQLNGCETELMAILEVFKMTCGIQLSSALLEMELGAERYHAELLGLIEGQSVRFESCSASSINESYRQLSASSSIFPLLPPTPQIFHGRESELQEISTTLLGHYPRVAVLGPGGIGKTSLAAAAIHSPLIVERFVHRHFISCESASSGKDLIAMVGAHFGLEPSRTLSQEIRNHLTAQGDTLIVLDNLETLWEPANSRADVEQFLSILDDVPQLALMVFYSETVVLCVLRARSRSRAPLIPGSGTVRRSGREMG
ncbi:hypothetical protein DFH09DRAFT_1029795 [Mycena vulgaris]|nr:hypothetical protein DFH09DRAFT_1029795 [Mycena vulgaris]